MDEKLLKTISDRIGVTVQKRNQDTYMNHSLQKRARHWVRTLPRQSRNDLTKLSLPNAEK
ncbi:hypothetical protein AAFX24_17810 [Vibrio mediterranei]|uniref:hypothetical protein n=1 Tax=Vibrio mediterranei TaxID=689 RepID=UPI0038CE2921